MVLVMATSDFKCHFTSLFVTICIFISPLECYWSWIIVKLVHLKIKLADCFKDNFSHKTGSVSVEQFFKSPTNSVIVDIINLFRLEIKKLGVKKCYPIFESINRQTAYYNISQKHANGCIWHNVVAWVRMWHCTFYNLIKA